MFDTTAEARAVLLTVRRRIPAATSVRAAVDLSETMRRLALEQLKAANPTLGERQLVAKLIERRFAILLPTGDL